MTTEQSSTLVGRKEEVGKNYPMFIEKVTLLCGIIIFFLTFSQVLTQFENRSIGVLFTVIIYPFIILFFVEMIGRIIQKMHNDA